MNFVLSLAFICGSLFTPNLWAQSDVDSIKSLDVQGEIHRQGELSELLKKNLTLDSEEGTISIKITSKLNGRNLFRIFPADMTLELTKNFYDEQTHTIKLETQCEVKSLKVTAIVFKPSCLDSLIEKLDEGLKLLSQEKRVRESLATTSMPKRYRKRAEPIVNVALVYYGDYYKAEDLDQVDELLKMRFHLATSKMLSMNTVIKRILPFKHQISQYPEYRQEYVTDITRLQRLWYYDNLGAAVINEVYDQVKKDLAEIDILLIVTGAQMDAAGFASGRVAITENPMDYAWALPDGGGVDFLSYERVADVLLHEMGHTMFLDHSSSHCFKPGMDYRESRACCAESAGKDDVMSYCRDKSKINENFFYGFKECNLRTIKNKILPAMLSGGAWNIPDREKCL